MKKLIELIKTKKYMHYIIIIVVALLVSIPFFWIQLKGTHDGKYHLLRLIGLDYATGESSFPFLVFPFFCKDWGYSMMAFYPPLVTYIPYILGLISGAFHVGLKLFGTLTTILSGIFMYNFINEVTKKKEIAILSAIIYIIMPYRFENLYNRFALGEFTAFIFIPIVFQGLYNLLHGDKKRHYYIAIGATGLLLSHSISTLYTAFFCLIYILFNLKLFFKKDVIIKCIINVVFILLMSAMFWIPMLEFSSEADYAIMQSEIMKTDSKHVADRTIEVWQFLKDKEEDIGVSFIFGIHFAVMLLIGILAYRNIDKKFKDFYIINLLLGIIGIFMCTNFFPWRIMPDIMGLLQFPWRMLGFAYFFFTPVCALNIYYLINPIKREWVRNIIYALVFIILAVCTVFELKIYTTDDITQDTKYEEYNYQNPQIHYFSINRDNMPVKALIEQNDYLKERTNDDVYVLSGNVEIVNQNKHALHMEFEVKNADMGTQLELPYLFYPGYDVILQYDDKEVDLEITESENGFLQVVIPENIENGKVTVDYNATILDKVAYVISGISIIVFIIYVICYRKKMKKEATDENKN